MCQNKSHARVLPTFASAGSTLLADDFLLSCTAQCTCSLLGEHRMLRAVLAGTREMRELSIVSCSSLAEGCSAGPPSCSVHEQKLWLHRDEGRALKSRHSTWVGLEVHSQLASLTLRSETVHFLHGCRPAPRNTCIFLPP